MVQPSSYRCPIGRTGGRREEYNGWHNHATWQTWLYVTNEQDTNRNVDAWRTNFHRKIRKGTFDCQKAEKVVKKYIVPMANMVGKKYGDTERINAKDVDLGEIVNAIIEE